MQPSLAFLPFLPFRPEYEQRGDDELGRQTVLVNTLCGISATTAADGHGALRSLHAKHHGHLAGSLEVLPLPPAYAQGLFAQPDSYSVLIRLSTSPGDLLPDDVSTPRGFAMKVLNVPGARLDSDARGTAQDFLLVDGPAFLTPSLGQFARALKWIAATTDKVPKLKRAVSAVLRVAVRCLRALGIESSGLKSLGGHPLTHLLGETYFSQVPFLYGPWMAKFALRPLSPEICALKDAELPMQQRPDALRQAVSEHFAGCGAQWELCVQLCTSRAAMPIEDPTVRWPEGDSPFVPVARLTVAPQASWIEWRSRELDEALVFSPWQGLAAHRPLGAINRARRPAYAASAQARAARASAPLAAPCTCRRPVETKP